MTTENKPLALELWDVYDIKPYPKNAKKHSEKQIKEIAAALRQNGFILDQPIVLDKDGVIIKGHGRQLAVKYNHENHGGPRKAPVFVRADLTPEQVDAARLSDNAVVSTDYDNELMKEELQRLYELGMSDSLIETGFTDKDFQFSTEDLGALADEDADIFVEDITTAVETQKTENAAKEKEVDSSAAPISDAFGFKRVSIEQSRRIRDFMGAIETATGKSGAEALIAHIETVV